MNPRHILPRSLLGALLVLAWAPAKSAGAGELDGEDLFIACAGCHPLAQGQPHGVGPNLFALAGRAAATQAGYAYSPALQTSGIVWNRGTLTGWVLMAEHMVPGTWMLYYNHLGPDEVTRLVDYLLQVR